MWRGGSRGWLTLEATVGDPNFGRAVPCVCRQQREEDRPRLVKYSNLGSLTRFTFETVAPDRCTRLAGSLDSYQRAYATALDFSNEPDGWLVILGPHGSGKTMLAAAVANRCIDRGQAVFFSYVPDLLDHLRSTFNPASDDVAYSALFEQVKASPFLVLDGLGSHSTTPWAEEKLGQIINHRYNAALPTIVTSSATLDALDPFVATRLQSPGSRVVVVESEEAKPDSPLGGIDPGLLERMTFETYDLRGTKLRADEKASLEAAFQAACSFADSPDGWLVLSGDTGVGKTHLAVAVAGRHIAQGRRVIFTFLPDLMDYLRDTFGPGSRLRYGHVFEEVKTAPLLVLDDFGKERRSEWAIEKLYQIIVHRHNARLPTVITTMREFTNERDPIISRILDPSLTTHVQVTAPDYRPSYRASVGRRRPREESR